MMKYRGSCLCGKVQFLVHKEIQTIYHCHCSLCRKQSGTGSNAATLISESFFEWLSATDLIATFKKDSGFTSCFCTCCGSPVPNRVGTSQLIWIPLGLLHDAPAMKQRLGLCLNSKIDWAPVLNTDREYLELPDWDELAQYFDSSHSPDIE